VPGSPESNESNPNMTMRRTDATGRQTAPAWRSARRALHPAAGLFAVLAIGVGLSFTASPIALATGAVLLGVLTLRRERRGARAEAPFLLLALIVFAAHLLFSGHPLREALLPAGIIALRLLALVYLARWAARAVLPGAARWLFGRGGIARPRPLALLVESGRMTLALLPLAIAESERQHLALRARAIRPGRGLAGRARYLAAWLLPYLGTMLRVGDAYAEALQARGHTLGARRRGAATYAWGVLEMGGTLLALAAAAWLLRAR